MTPAPRVGLSAYACAGSALSIAIAAGNEEEGRECENDSQRDELTRARWLEVLFSLNDDDIEGKASLGVTGVETSDSATFEEGSCSCSFPESSASYTLAHGVDQLLWS